RQGAPRGDARSRRGARARRVDRQPRDGQARRRGRVVGRALREGHEGALRLRRRPLYEPEADDKRDGGKPAAGAASAATDAPKAEKADAADDTPLPPLPSSPAPFPAGKPVAITGATILTVGPAG